MKKIIVIMRETFPTNEILTDKNLQEKYILNPYDEYVLSQAKKIKEKNDIEIVCAFLSHRESQYGLKTALALGADKGIFIYCKEKDPREMAQYLSLEIKKESYDYIFMGIRDVNDDREELPSRLSFLLEENLYSHVLMLDYNEKNYITIERERERAIDILEIQGRGIFAFSQNVREPEYPSIYNIISINEKPIVSISYPFYAKNKESKIHYQDVHRKQEVFGEIDPQKGTEILVEYMKKWKLLD